jgi:hypothetical protein
MPLPLWRLTAVLGSSWVRGRLAVVMAMSSSGSGDVGRGDSAHTHVLNKAWPTRRTPLPWTVLASDRLADIVAIASSGTLAVNKAWRATGTAYL